MLTHWWASQKHTLLWVCNNLCNQTFLFWFNVLLVESPQIPDQTNRIYYCRVIFSTLVCNSSCEGWTLLVKWQLHCPSRVFFNMVSFMQVNNDVLVVYRSGSRHNNMTVAEQLNTWKMTMTMFFIDSAWQWCFIVVNVFVSNHHCLSNILWVSATVNTYHHIHINIMSLSARTI